MSTIRDLEATRDETLAFFALGERDLDRRYGPDKWSVRYVLHHLADVETVELERIRRTLSESRPHLAGIDPDAWAEALEYQRLPLSLSRALFESARNAVIHYAGRFSESRGHLEYVHSQHGPMSLVQEFEKVARHNAKHLDHIRTALSRT
jgi:hypothetical protein